MLSRVEELPVRFLRLILPDQGHYIAAVKRPKGRGFQHHFVSTLEELWAVIESQDRDGLDTYHACASFKEARSDPPGTPDGQKRLGRTRHNARGAKAFWLDPDAGPEKPYAGRAEAVAAVIDFCRKTNLPPPIIVASGSGLHVYWPLQEMLDPETWKRYAVGLKNLCVKFGLHADPMRTADITSVLRTPGTHNHKRNKEQLVECDPEFLEIEPYSIEAFAIFLEHAEMPAGKRPHKIDFLLGPMPEYLRRRKRKLRVADLIGCDYPPASGALIAEHCEQVRALRDSKGCLPEPQWFAALGVLAFCEDGDELGHEWSSGDERYTEAETQGRLDRARDFGPTTCECFHSLNRDACERCKHWGKIKSPIQAVEPGAGNVLSPLRWEYTQGGAIKPKSYINAAVALGQLGIKGRHDTFHDKKIIEGDVAENLGPELSDAICRAIRECIISRFGFDPGIENVQQAAERFCERKRFDPVLDYLDSLGWDGQPRLDRWLVTYLSSDDADLNREIGRKMLIAAVRRVRQPGCKFDYVPVLEGPQGSGKSSTLRILAGEDNFSDQPLLHLETRAQQEAMQGVWIYEISELVGLRRTEIETVKGFLSKTADNARAAYGRFRTDQQRRCIFVGTTNDNEYLRDATGNRRFWPVRTGKIDLLALQRDRRNIGPLQLQLRHRRVSRAGRDD
jgi:hypothetical protein